MRIERCFETFAWLRAVEDCAAGADLVARTRGERDAVVKRIGSGTVAIGLAAAGAAAWWLRHVTAPAVRKWQPGCGEIVSAGDLAIRVCGSGDRAFVLLHGLVASGDVFGAAFDRLTQHGRLIVPDLFGFGRSMRVKSQSFGLEDHLDALDAMLEALGANAARLVIGGHSLGGLLALHWAARRQEQVDAVLTWGAPLFRDEAEARERLQAMGFLEQLFARDSPMAEKSCEWMCRYRGAAAVAAAILSPDLPIPISRRAVLHTWPAYRGAVGIFFSDWRAALSRLHDAGVPVTITAGSDDPSQVAGLAHTLAADFATIRAFDVEGAAHTLPLTHPDQCAASLLRCAARGEQLRLVSEAAGADVERYRSDS